MKIPILLACLATVIILAACAHFTETDSVERLPNGQSFTNRHLSRRVTDTVHTIDEAGSAAGVPWAHTAAEGFLAVTTLGVTIWNGWKKRQLARAHDQTKTALKEALGRLADTATLTRQDR